MILVTGGFGWNGVKAAENLKDLDLSKYDRVITNGLTGFCLSCYKLGKISLLNDILCKITPFLNKIDKDYFFIGNIRNCIQLSKNFGDFNYEIEDKSWIDFNLEIEMINLKTEEIGLKKLRLWRTLTFIPRFSPV